MAAPSKKFNLFRKLPQYTEIEKFEGRPEASSGQCSYVEYKYEDVRKSPIYKIMPMEDAEIQTAYNSIMDRSKTEITEKQFLAFIAAGLNVKGKVSRSPLLTFAGNPAGVCDDYETAQPSNDHTSAIDHGLPAGFTVVGDGVPGSQQTTTILTEHISRQAHAMSFICAWMTRFIIKEATDTLDQQVTAMSQTYKTLYTTTSEVFKSFKPTKELMASLQAASQVFPRCKATLAWYVAEGETHYRLANTGDYNILRFLYFQSLEFVGMHAYVAMIEILRKMSIPSWMVFSWLTFSGTQDALKEICDIMCRYDNGMIKDGFKANRFWKYARLFNEGYFNKLQTSYNADLVALLSAVKIELGLADATGYRCPLNIMAIRNKPNVRNQAQERAKLVLIAYNEYNAQSGNLSVLEEVLASQKGSIFEKQQEPTPVPEQRGVVRPRDEADLANKQQKAADGTGVKNAPASVPRPAVNLSGARAAVQPR